MANGARAKLITPAELEGLRYPVPKSLIRTAGLLKDKFVGDPVEWQRKIRGEWEQRLKKLHKQMDKTPKKTTRRNDPGH